MAVLPAKVVQRGSPGAIPPILESELKEMEKNVMCVLLQALSDKNLITQDTCEKAKTKILGTLDGPDFFCYCEEKRKEDANGHTQNSC